MEEYSDGKAHSLQNPCKRVGSLQAVPPEALIARAVGRGQQRGKEKEALSRYKHWAVQQVCKAAKMVAMKRENWEGSAYAKRKMLTVSEI
jgi:hypothetical protein